MKKVLILQTGKLGDMVCSTPVFRAVKKHFPDVYLIASGDALGRDIIRGNPYVDQYEEYGNLSVKLLREINPDTSILLTPSPDVLKNLILARLPRVLAPRVVGGYSPYPTKTYRFFSLFADKIPHRMGYYAPQEYLNMLHPLGIESNDTRKELFVDRQTEDKMVSQLLRFGDKRKIAIAPGAGNRIKEWPPERFGEISKYLIDKHNAIIIIIGSEKDKALGEIVKMNLPQESVWDTTGTFSIEELKALVKCLDLFISADTGPIYIAEAFGVPTVDIVGPVDEREQPPRGEKNR